MQTLDYRVTLQRVATLMAVIALSLVLLAGLTGVLLAFYYEPTAGGAHNSLQFISQNVSGGALIRSLHDIAGNAIIGVALLQLVVMFLGRQFRSSWYAAWVSGILLTLVAIALSWTAIILDWDQVGYWRFKLELGTIESIPLIGEGLQQILIGGALNSITVQHLYTLHGYVFSGVAIALSVFHLATLVYQEQERRRTAVSS
ncbi:MAG: cytochrome b N-terminal domain-containing protein [Oculatellaceae cyanobacterium Prado106]|jgi:cytochrome b6|nr:cytochrome b N-terminal domain-containing protein [Oculatellaceae cyanobacterium Prado106]